MTLGIGIHVEASVNRVGSGGIPSLNTPWLEVDMSSHPSQLELAPCAVGFHKTPSSTCLSFCVLGLIPDGLVFIPFYKTNTETANVSVSQLKHVTAMYLSFCSPLSKYSNATHTLLQDMVFNQGTSCLI